MSAPRRRPAGEGVRRGSRGEAPTGGEPGSPSGGPSGPPAARAAARCDRARIL